MVTTLLRGMCVCVWGGWLMHYGVGYVWMGGGGGRKECVFLTYLKKIKIPGFTKKKVLT